MSKNVIILDMHGPVYRYNEKPGVELVETITPAQSAEAEAVFEEAAKRFAGKNSELYEGALAMLSGKAGSMGNFLELEQALVFDILAGKDAPCGLALNQSAVKYVLETLQSKVPVVVSTSMIGTSQGILERNLSEYARNNSRVEVKSLSDLGITVANIAEFGSKKKAEAWLGAYENVLASVSQAAGRPTIDAVVEDNPKKCEAAFEAASKFNKGAVPQAYHQIGPKGLVYVPNKK